MRNAYRVKARLKGCGGYTSAMRPSWLGNPYPVSEYGLEESLNLYRKYFYERLSKDVEFYDRFMGLLEQTPVYFGCTCPLDQPCHTDTLVAALRLLDGVPLDWLKSKTRPVKV